MQNQVVHLQCLTRSVKAIANSLEHKLIQTFQQPTAAFIFELLRHTTFLLFSSESSLFTTFIVLSSFSFTHFSQFLYWCTSCDHIIIWLLYCTYTCVPVCVNNSWTKAAIGCWNVWITLDSVCFWRSSEMNLSTHSGLYRVINVDLCIYLQVSQLTALPSSCTVLSSWCPKSKSV